MKLHRWIAALLLLLTLLFLGCATPSRSSKQTTASTRLPIGIIRTLIEEGRADEIRDTYLTPLMTELALKERGAKGRVYCARTPEETLTYLLLFGAAESKSVEVLDYDYALAYYYSAYLFVEEGNWQAALNDLGTALNLSPYNASFLNELGHIYQAQHDWERSLAIFQKAEKHASAFSPEHLKNEELTRALRGQGFTLIELQKLEEAQAVFQKCLKIDPLDERSRSELRYIEHIQKKA